MGQSISEDSTYRRWRPLDVECLDDTIVVTYLSYEQSLSLIWAAQDSPRTVVGPVQHGPKAVSAAREVSWGLVGLLQREAHQAPSGPLGGGPD